MSNVHAKDRRGKFRVKLSCLVRVRPSMPVHDRFEDVIATENSTREGFYARTILARYMTNMRVFVMFPYSAAFGAINRDFLGEVVRVDQLPDGLKGVAIRILDKLALSVQEDIPSDSSDQAAALWWPADDKSS